VTVENYPTETNAPTIKNRILFAINRKIGLVRSGVFNLMMPLAFIAAMWPAPVFGQSFEYGTSVVVLRSPDGLLAASRDALICAVPHIPRGRRCGVRAARAERVSKPVQLIIRKESAMTIELPEKLGAVLKAQANAHHISPDGYVREVLERDLATSLEEQSSCIPFKTGRGMFAKYGQAPSADEIDANRADMFRNFGENF
jgi:hypothetical protein